MGFRINTNIAAMNAHGNSVMNNRNLDDSLSKLSSGLRINKAADDASGMVIANALRNQANSLGQAVSNGNDAIGLIQTADGALNEYSKILDTIKTKAVQAASDNQNTSSRSAIQKDINRLMEELNTIAKTTSFNGQKLLSGAFTNKTIQMGASSNEGVNFSVASAETSKLGHTSRATLNLTSDTGSVQLTVKSALTGDSITMKAIDIQYNNSAVNGIGALADEINSHSGDTGVRAQAIVSVESATSIQAGTADMTINGVSIGAIQVKANDGDGALLSAINSKSTQTGVVATLNGDGKMTLTSADGRAIKTEGSTSAVFGSSATSLTSVGHIELIQKGAAEFQINGIGTGAVTNKVTTNALAATVKDSILDSGTGLIASSIFKTGTVTGANIRNTGTVLTVIDSQLKAGSILATASIVNTGTTIGGTITQAADETLLQDSFVTSGSTLKIGSILGAGTVMQQDFTDGTVSFTKGQVLASAYTTTTADLTLTADMTLKYSATAANNSMIKTASTLQAGTIVGAATNQSATLSSVMSQDMILKSGSTLGASSSLLAGSTVGGDFTINAAGTTYLKTELKAASTLQSGTALAAGSTVGAELSIAAIAAGSFTKDMLLKAGSTVAAGTVLAAGTQLNQDVTLATIAYKAGDVLEQDRTVGAGEDFILAKDMVLKGSSTAQIGAGTKLMTNTENAGTVGLSAGAVTNLSGISVLDLKSAMKTIDTLDAAIGDLDTIRADLGSVQNQVVATINNISVTQVNVKAAESQLRDVDFAQESANFSKFNILAQSGSYAMSQANAVQQNVLRLLQ